MLLNKCNLDRSLYYAVYIKQKIYKKVNRMKNRIVCKSLVAGMVSFSLLLGQVVPAFGAVQDKESVRKYYHYQDVLSEAKKRVVKAAKKAVTYDKSSSDTVEEQTDEYGAVTKDTYDESGNLINRKVNGKDVVQFSYDSAGNITSIKDALNFETKYEYDESNRLIANIDALGNKTNYTYDGENLSKVILPDNAEKMLVSIHMIIPIISWLKKKLMEARVSISMMLKEI